MVRPTSAKLWNKELRGVHYQKKFQPLLLAAKAIRICPEKEPKVKMSFNLHMETF